MGKKQSTQKMEKNQKTFSRKTEIKSLDHTHVIQLKHVISSDCITFKYISMVDTYV